MRPGARIKAASEILEDILTRHRPASNALADWGKSSRFAGSGDRSAVGTLVYDALRRRSSIAFRMGSDTPRALALGAAVHALGVTPEAVVAMADGSEHTVAAPTSAERAGLDRDVSPDDPDHVRGDFPEWLTPSLVRAFGTGAAAQGEALARRAPVDLRVNTLKSTRDRILKTFAKTAAIATPLSPVGVRIPAPEGGARAPNVEAEAGHGKGWFEVQDEGSQIASLMAGAGPRQQILDICAGAGGKTLAMAAAMQNTGQIYAYDDDRVRLRPIFERLKRAGVRNAQILDAGDETALTALGPRFDCVLADAPCTGTGVWRRRPDSKWRLRPDSIPVRQGEQRQVLTLAASMVKPGGRLVYVTCSILPEENGDQIDWFLQANPDFTVTPIAQVWAKTVAGIPAPASADGSADALLLTPASHGTDGFFIAVLTRKA
jgi:16S rRNA (cytosine967-C5)-methyltransferase